MKNGKDEVGTILDKRENAVFGSELEKNLLKVILGTTGEIGTLYEMIYK